MSARRVSGLVRRKPSLDAAAGVAWCRLRRASETTTPDGNTTFDTWYQLDEFGDATVTLTGR